MKGKTIFSLLSFMLVLAGCAEKADLHEETVAAVPFTLTVREPEVMVEGEPWTKCSLDSDDFALEMRSEPASATKASRLTSLPEELGVKVHLVNIGGWNSGYYSDFLTVLYEGIMSKGTGSTYSCTGVTAPVVTSSKTAFVYAYSPAGSPYISHIDPDMNHYIPWIAYSVPADLSLSEDFCAGYVERTGSFSSASLTLHHLLAAINVETRTAGATGTLKEIAFENIIANNITYTYSDVVRNFDPTPVTCALSMDTALTGAAGQSLVSQSLGNEFFMPSGFSQPSGARMRIKVDRGSGDEYLYASIGGTSFGAAGTVTTYRITIPAASATWSVTPELLEWEAADEITSPKLVTVTGNDLTGLQASLQGGSHYICSVVSNTGITATVRVAPSAANTGTTAIEEVLTLMLGGQSKTVDLVHKGSTHVIIVVE